MEVPDVAQRMAGTPPKSHLVPHKACNTYSTLFDEYCVGFSADHNNSQNATSSILWSGIGVCFSQDLSFWDNETLIHM